MACAFLTHTKKHPDAVALDLSRKPAGCNAGCQCINCMFNGIVPVGARNLLLNHWTTQGHFLSASPSFNFYSNQFKPEDQQFHRERTRKSSEHSAGSPNTILRTSPAPVSVTAPQQSPRGIAHYHTDDPRKSPVSPFSSNRSSPVNGYFQSPSFHNVAPDALGRDPAAPFGSQHLPLGMLSPQQLPLNTWFPMHSIETSPTSTKSSSDTRSGCSSPTAQSLTSSDTPSTAPKKLTDSPKKRTAAPKKRTGANAEAAKYDKNSIYWQKRLRNNEAAKRSRDHRRKKEDEIAETCTRMMDIQERLQFIRSEYVKFLS